MKQAALSSFLVPLLAMTLGGVLSGCATVGARSQGRTSGDSNSPRTVGEAIQQSNLEQSGVFSGGKVIGSSTSKGGAKKVEYGDIVIQGKHLKNTTFDIPITINSRVEYWVDYFTGRGQPFFEKYLERAEFFIPYMRPILRQSGIPEDFVYLAMIESGFNNFARSQAKAVGPWQFISATGKRYGLAVNWWVDERRDIRKSTIAAVEYLKELMGIFNSFELASASYNAGEGKVARAVQRFGTKDFWAISKHRFLKPETRDYVPKIIAAALIAKNRTQFGFPAETTAPQPGSDEAVSSDGEIVKLIKTEKSDDHLDEKIIAKDAGLDSSEVPDASDAEDDAADAAVKNSGKSAKVAEKASEKVSEKVHDENVGDLLTRLTKSDLKDEDEEDSDDTNTALVPATLLVPEEPTLPEGQQASSEPQAKPVPTPHMSKNGEVGGAELAEFDIKSPADLLKVARAAGLSYQTVKSLNPELLRWCTPPNVSSYRVRLPASVKDRFLATYNLGAFPRHVDFMTYKVTRGETLAAVAKHFGIKVDPISDLNGVSPRMPLRKGARILLPMPNDRSRSIASLEVRDPPEHRRKHRRRRRFSKISFRQRNEATRSGYFRSHAHSG